MPCLAVPRRVCRASFRLLAWCSRPAYCSRPAVQTLWPGVRRTVRRAAHLALRCRSIAARARRRCSPALIAACWCRGPPQSLVGLVSCAGVSNISARAAAQRVREDPLSGTCITRAWLRLATLQRLSRAACHVTAKSAGHGIPRLSPSDSREVNQVQVAVSRNGWSEYDTKVTSHNIAFLQSS